MSTTCWPSSRSISSKSLKFLTASLVSIVIVLGTVDSVPRAFPEDAGVSPAASIAGRRIASGGTLYNPGKDASPSMMPRGGPEIGRPATLGACAVP